MSWDDGKQTKVKSVNLTFDDVIRSIEVKYDGTTLSQRRGTNGTKSDGFTLSPDEYITDVTGYYKTTFSGDVITALTFKTNKNTYGSYGNTTRSSFSVNAPKDNQIAGFLGTSGNALNSIDVHFAPIPPVGDGSLKPGGSETTHEGTQSGGTEGTQSGGTDSGGIQPSGTGSSVPQPGGPGTGPDSPQKPGDTTQQKLDAQGGKGGNQWDDGADHDGVTKISVGFDGSGIKHVKFDYLKNGQTKEGPVHGGEKGRGFVTKVEINHPNEYIVSVKGWYDSSNIIQGIQFKTNTKSSEYIGYEFSGDGKQFSLQVEDKKIIGFHGFSGDHLNSIGAYFSPISSTPLKPAKKLEAIGGDEGALWDDGAFDGVRKIYVGQGNDGVSFVKIEYNEGSQTVIGQGHGKATLLDPETFELEYPSEYITAVGVYYDKLQVENRGTTLVTSLVFTTYKRKSQPYGLTGGEYFEFKEEGHKIVGFHGKAGDVVHQVGVYVAPITN